MHSSANRPGLADYLRSHPHPGGIIVCPQRQFIYMKPSKTAGTSILRATLEKAVPGILHYKDHPQAFGNWLTAITDEELQAYYIFSVARNPWDRMVSLAAYFQIPFEDFVANFDRHCENREIGEHALPLSIYTHLDGVLFADEVCRFETLQQDIGGVLARIGIKESQLPHRNRTQHDHYSRYYGKYERERVAQLYAQDIHNFGYAFETQQVAATPAPEYNAPATNTNNKCQRAESPKMFENVQNGYVLYHLPRYRAMMGQLRNFHFDGARILDIGKSAFAGALHDEFGPVDTLGLNEEQATGYGHHHHFDLNACQDRSAWRDDLPGYDIIVFAEVIEHLYTSPNHVLPFLRSLLNDGGMIFIQTPNAVALHKRVDILRGRNPFDLIREDASNPGHFREYTFAELENYIDRNGLEIVSASYDNYFDFRYSDHAHGRVNKNQSRAVINLLYKLLPGPLKPGMFFIARKA